MGILITIIAALLIFAAVFAVLSKVVLGRKSKYTKRSLESISKGEQDEFNQDVSFEGAAGEDAEGLLDIPVLGGIYRKLRATGSEIKFSTYMIILGLVFVGITYLASLIFSGQILIALPAGLIAAYVANNVYLGIMMDKRNDQFLEDFPDVIDMIVRSIRSGHPLVASLKLIAENFRAPLSTEFQRVIDEVAYGRPLSEALRKMADRIGILDVSFFVVILSVQQETGGSMAEVLSNLSNIIRKRKQLRLKIRALTAEGKMTIWIFSAIPFVQLLAVYFLSPDYLDPLFQTTTGYICLIAVICMISLAVYIARQLCKLDI